MTSMMEITKQDGSLQAGISHISQPAMTYNIKRSGARPLRFEGSELAMAMSYSSAIPYWYEINLYRTLNQDFVSTVRLFHQSEDRQDSVHAWESKTLDEAIECLTRYDAANDVPISIDLQLTEAPASEMAATALGQMARIEDARHHYRSLIGEFLFDLEN